MPAVFSEWFECDAQRYLSLYTPESLEEIFTYARPDVRPTTLLKVKLPMLVVLAGDDEYGDLPADAIARWFDATLEQKSAAVIGGVGHSFKGKERALAKKIAMFMKEA